MKIIFKLGYTEEDQLPRKSQYRTKQMIQLLEYLKSIPGEHLDKRCYRELSGGQQQRVLFPISVCMVCIDRRNTCYWISFDEYIFDRTESLWRCIQYIIWINIHPYVNTRGSFIMCGSFNHGCDIIHPAVFGIIISILTETPVGSTIVAIDMIAFATASIFGKVIAM